MSSVIDFARLLDLMKTDIESKILVPEEPVDVSYTVTVKPSDVLTNYYSTVESYYKVVEVSGRNVFMMYGTAGQRKTTTSPTSLTTFFQVDLSKTVLAYYSVIVGGRNWNHVDAWSEISSEGKKHQICTSMEMIYTTAYNGGGTVKTCEGFVVADTFGFYYWVQYPYCTGVDGLNFALVIVPLKEVSS